MALPVWMAAIHSFLIVFIIILVLIIIIMRDLILQAKIGPGPNLASQSWSGTKFCLQ